MLLLYRGVCAATECVVSVKWMVCRGDRCFTLKDSLSPSLPLSASPSALSLQHVHEELDLAELAALLALDGGLLVKQGADGHEVTVAGVALLVPARQERNE